ncbi:MAG: hypothetical protein WBB82_03155 [Limnothrix sp.]
MKYITENLHCWCGGCVAIALQPTMESLFASLEIIAIETPQAQFLDIANAGDRHFNCDSDSVCTE